MLKKFPDGARVVFIGDSITAENLSLQWIIRAYKNEGYNVKFFNCGVAGGTADFAVTSYHKDTGRYSPTHAFISFGINDSNRDLLMLPRSEDRLKGLVEAYERYKTRLAELVDKLLLNGVEVTLCTPVPYDEYTETEIAQLRGGYALMLGYAEYVRNLAKEKGVALYDQHATISECMAGDDIFSSDHIHPTPHGYYVLAREILRAQGIDIGKEETLPESFTRWHSYVARLRKVIATECMLVPKLGVGFNSPSEDKLSKMQGMIDRKEWGVPVLESFCRAYMLDKPHEEELYSLIDKSYEEDIM